MSRRRRSLPLLILPLLASGYIAADARDASACGGCFHGPPAPTEVESVVTDHRMVFSVSPVQTILWDQIRYSGNPLEFAWVLPVHPGAHVELSSDAWLAALDATSQPVVTGPSANCPGSFSGSSSSGGGGCGSSTEDSATFAGVSGDAGFAPSEGVQLVSQDVVGPYETVTLRSSQGDALETWLTTNGFLIPDAIRPTLSAYAAEGFDFIALKLRPGEGVRAMQPVRIVTAGADASLPLRMVAAGIGARVGITLYVVSEGRYHPESFPDAVIDYSRLTWDPVQNRSNYPELIESAMTAGDGRGWVTEFSGPIDAQNGTFNQGGGKNPRLVDAYSSLCPQTQPRGFPGCDAAAPPPVDAGASDGGDGGDASDAPDGSPVSDGGGSSCASSQPVLCDDLKAATVGLHTGDVWVTRLRANLPANALAAGDLRLAASPAQLVESNQHTTSTYSDPNYNPCPNAAPNNNTSSAPGCVCESSKPSRRGEGSGKVGTYALLLLTAGAVGAMLRAKERGRAATEELPARQKEAAKLGPSSRR